MSHWTRQCDMPHTFTTHLSKRYFNATFFTDHTAVLEALVFTAKALVITGRAKNLGAKQAITLWLECTVVDGLRLFHFAIRPGTDHVR